MIVERRQQGYTQAAIGESVEHAVGGGYEGKVNEVKPPGFLFLKESHSDYESNREREEY